MKLIPFDLGSFEVPDDVSCNAPEYWELLHEMVDWDKVEGPVEEVEILLSTGPRVNFQAMTGIILGRPVVEINALVIGAIKEIYKNHSKECGAAALASLIAHESKHFQQIQEGKLQLPAPGVAIWNGELFHFGDYRVTEKRYLELPWEEEAFHIGLKVYYEIMGSDQDFPKKWEEFKDTYPKMLQH